MEIIHKEIPKEFLEVLPEGMKLISKEGKEFLVIEKICCSEGHNLIDNAVHIHGEPSIKLNVKIGSSKGSIFVDAFWGSHAKLFSFMPGCSDTSEILEVFCPICGKSIIVDRKCTQDKCDSTKSIELILPGQKNKILVCAKLGCPGHRIEINAMQETIVKTVSEINYFGTGVEDADWFKGV